MDTIGDSLQNLMNWLKTMHSNGEYTGPVVHYWRYNLLFTGAATDWRYEGLIEGFLILYNKTKDRRFLEKSMQLSQECLSRLTPKGFYQNSGFEQAPLIGFTPHEASVTKAILNVVLSLRENKDSRYKDLWLKAKRNIDVHLRFLWSNNFNAFVELPYPIYESKQCTNVNANKNSTISEMFLYAYKLTGDEIYKEKAIKSLSTIKNLQDADGGFYQSRFGSQKIAYYNARCARAFLTAYTVLKDDKYLDWANEIKSFLKPLFNEEKIIFRFGKEKGKVLKYPMWIAGAGDIFFVLYKLDEANFVTEIINKFIKLYQLKSGGFKSFKYYPSKEWCFTEILPVVGWNDKIFFLLSNLITEDDANSLKLNNNTMDECELKLEGDFKYFENSTQIACYRNSKIIYRWKKGFPSPEIYERDFIK